jgi:tRNA threonylcarbamoyladenosine biosynthesis protein TsaB
MQKPQITYYFALQATYEHLEIGLFANNDRIEYRQDDKLSINRVLIDRLTIMLSNHDLSLEKIAFFVANAGPGPFSSLRVLLTTLNGISFARNIPLIGIDGLKLLIEEQTDEAWPITVALLNAYNNDCYYALQQPSKELEVGCINIEQLPDVLPCNQPIRVIGQGAELFRPKLEQLSSIFIDKTIPRHVSLNFIANKGFFLYKTDKIWPNQLFPLYLKQTNYKPAF